MQERAVEEVKLAIKPFYQKREVTKEEYKDILRKAVQKVGCAGKQSCIHLCMLGILRLWVTCHYPDWPDLMWQIATISHLQGFLL
jgi:hypothetical protein